MEGPTIVWNMQVTLDRQVALPGEDIHLSFTLFNPLQVPLFIDAIQWNTSFYPPAQAVTQPVGKVVMPSSHDFLGSGLVRVPDVPDGQYRVDVAARTLVYTPVSQQWTDFGLVPLTVPATLLVVHTPRYRAFVSRSLRVEDRPVADAIVQVIQLWGFAAHTVGSNECETAPRRLPERFLAEIVKADCLFGIGTTRDISALDHLARTLPWLNSESSFAFVAKKPLLLIVDQSVRLEGFLASPDLTPLRYDPANLPVTLGWLNAIMPLVRQAIERHTKTQAIMRQVEAEQVVAYGAFIAGTVARKLPG